MATELKLPESLQGVEGVTINRWLVQPGSIVKAGNAVVEVASDKVDVQIETPASGTLLKINFGDGEVLPAGAVLALIGDAGEATQAKVEAAAEVEKAPAVPAEPKATPVARRIAEEEGVPLAAVRGTGAGGQVTKEDVLAYAAERKAKVGAEARAEKMPAEAPSPRPMLPPDLANIPAPVVVRLAAEHSINLKELAGGRPLSTLTKYDVLSAIASKVTAFGQRAGKPVVVPPRSMPDRPAPAMAAQPLAAAAIPAPAQPTPAAQPAPKLDLRPEDEFVPHTRMRALVARRTTESAFTIPHVTTMWDVNMAAVLEHRAAHKAEFAAAGVNLTITAYLVQAVIAGLKAVPGANSTWTDEGLIIHRYYNVGVAVALPPDKNGIGGLIVPVIKSAADLSLMGIARAVNDLAQRARDGRLVPDDLQGGTFTLTNYGTSGSRFQTPVILPGQAGILGVGAIEKRPVVVSPGHPLAESRASGEANRGDYLAFLPMTTLGFSYDHRVLDGASADAFCAAVKEALEKVATPNSATAVLSL